MLNYGHTFGAHLNEIITIVPFLSLSRPAKNAFGR